MAVRNLTLASSNASQIDLDMVAVIKIISPRRLIDGGAAILAAVNINNHIVIMGLIVIRPFVKNILRV
jgi:hypothetical protein